MRLTLHHRKDRLAFQQQNVWVASLAQPESTHFYHIHPVSTGFAACFTNVPKGLTAPPVEFPPEGVDTQRLGRYSTRGEAIRACSTHAEVLDECYAHTSQRQRQ
jgi:hypothetical protein